MVAGCYGKISLATTMEVARMAVAKLEVAKMEVASC